MLPFALTNTFAGVFVMMFLLQPMLRCWRVLCSLYSECPFLGHQSHFCQGQMPFNLVNEAYWYFYFSKGHWGYSNTTNILRYFPSMSLWDFLRSAVSLFMWYTWLEKLAFFMSCCFHFTRSFTFLIDKVLRMWPFPRVTLRSWTSF